MPPSQTPPQSKAPPLRDGTEPWELVTRQADSLRAIVELQREDRAARDRAEQALHALQLAHEQLQAEVEAARAEAAAERTRLQAESAAGLARSVLRIDELERSLGSKDRALLSLSQRHDALSLRQESQADRYLAEIERLREQLAQLEARAKDRRLRFPRMLLGSNRFTRHRTHPLIDGLLLPGQGPSHSPELIMDAPLFTRTNFQPLFAPRADGVYEMAEFLALHDRSFVRAAYLAILRREPDPDGAENYLGLLRSGEHKARLLGHLLSSDEARQHQTVIHGLKAHIRFIRICELPVVGRLISAILFLANVNGHLRDLRVLENHMIRIAEESQAIHEANMSKLRSISK